MSAKKRARSQASSAAPKTIADLPECFELNVGGFLYSVRKSTLADAPPGKLQSLAVGGGGGADDVIFDEEGRPFFDVDGVAFEAVLSFLRQGVAIVPRDSTMLVVHNTLGFFFDAPPTPLTERQVYMMSSSGMISLKKFFHDHVKERFLRRLRKLASAEECVMRYASSGIAWTLIMTQENGEAVSLIMSVAKPSKKPDENDKKVDIEDIKWFMHSLDNSEQVMNDVGVHIRRAFAASDVSILAPPSTAPDILIRVTFMAQTQFAVMMRKALDEAPPAEQQ